MNASEKLCTWLVLAGVVGVATAMPYGGAQMQMDTLYDRSMGWMDFLSPYFSTTSENKKACIYKANSYEDGSLVTTEEPCLKCRCLRGTLVCYLRVCPLLPDPPPPNCVLVLRHGACCTELICEDGSINTNHISRSDSGLDLSTNTTAYRDGCLSNGTLYASGSAMWTKRPCEYCYCIGGKERCVKPRCLPPPESCAPQRAAHSCCPIRYECEHDLASITSTSSTTLPASMKDRACTVDGIIYPEGEKVINVAKSPCDNCFCMRGMVRCVPLSCAPPLLGCTPTILPGECCASSYNCTKQISHNNIKNELLPSDSEEGTIVNERSFPDDTLLTPSQIADILLGDGRNYRRIENKLNASTSNEQNITDDIVHTTMSTTVMGVDLATEISNNSITTQKVDHTTVISENLESIISLMKNISSDFFSNNITNNVISEEMNVTNKTITPINETLISSNNTKNDSITSDNSKTIINDTINCTTEISSIEDNLTSSFEKISNNFNASEIYSDVQERVSSVTLSDDNSIDTKKIEEKYSDSSTEKNSTDLFKIESKYPSTSLIIPKDDDIIMVNVSTYVRTNTSVVTLRPVAAIPPEIEALLNISMKKNNQKDDYYDYDYKSSLPPSLPNLEIIPFLAIDAVLKSDEIERAKNKEIDHFATSYPSMNDDQDYIKSFPSASRDKHNSTPYPYITSDTYNPTTFSPYSEEKYLGNPTNFPNLSLRNFNRNTNIYNKLHKQHIDDKFQATTYKTIVDDKYVDIQYGIDKYDATIYPSITLDDSQTENPAFRYEAQTHNLFSPPIETEGGFLPRDPPLLGSYFNMGYPTSEDNSGTDPSLITADSLKTPIDGCISNGRKYKNGQLVTEPNSCIVCFCYYGDIHCQDPECPPIKSGCRRIMEKGVNSCCGVEICNELKENGSTIHNSLEKNSNFQNIHDVVERIDSNNNYKEIIQTESPEKPQTVLIDTMPVYTKTSLKPSSTITEPSSTMRVEYIPSSTKKTTTASPTTEIHKSQNYETTTRTETRIDPLNFINKNEYSLFNDNKTDTESELIEDEPEQEDEDEGFSFDAVLKLLLGDSSDTTVKTTTRTTTRLTTPVTSPPTTRAQTTYKPTEVTPKITIKSTTPRTIITTALFRNTQKYSYNKPNRTSNPVSLIHKNYTKPIRTTTRTPIVYSNINRPTKPKYTFTSSTTSPASILPTRKIPFSPLPLVTEQVKSSQKKSSTTSSSSTIPFGAGLLKLAGCNIYGRMYRVGRIISELSGPCLECMCTEIGVQCTPLTC